MMYTRRPDVLPYLVLGLAAVLAGCTGYVPNPRLRLEGMEAYQQNDISTARARFDKAIKQDPTDWKSQYYTGLVRLKQGNPVEAQMALEKSLSLRPHDPEYTPSIIDALAESLYEQDRTEELYAVLAKAGHDYGTMHDFLREATYKSRSGDSDGAKTAFKKAARFADADDATPYIKMADFFESIGDADAALLVLRQAYTIMPNSQTLGDRIRKYGVVPGPTIALPPEGAEKR